MQQMKVVLCSIEFMYLFLKMTSGASMLMGSVFSLLWSHLRRNYLVRNYLAGFELLALLVAI